MVKEPLLKVCFPGDEVIREIMKRAVLIKSISELVGEADSVEEIKDCQDNALLTPWAGKRFKVRINTVDRRMKNAQKVQMIEKLDLDALSPINVSLKNAEVTFYIIIDPVQHKCYFGRLVARSRISNTKQYFHSMYDVAQRPY